MIQIVCFGVHSDRIHLKINWEYIITFDLCVGEFSQSRSNFAILLE